MHDPLRICRMSCRKSAEFPRASGYPQDIRRISTGFHPDILRMHPPDFREQADRPQDFRCHSGIPRASGYQDISAGYPPDILRISAVYQADICRISSGYPELLKLMLCLQWKIGGMVHLAAPPSPSASPRLLLLSPASRHLPVVCPREPGRGLDVPPASLSLPQTADCTSLQPHALALLSESARARTGPGPPAGPDPAAGPGRSRFKLKLHGPRRDLLNLNMHVHGRTRMIIVSPDATGTKSLLVSKTVHTIRGHGLSRSETD